MVSVIRLVGEVTHHTVTPVEIGVAKIQMVQSIHIFHVSPLGGVLGGSSIIQCFGNPVRVSD